MRASIAPRQSAGFPAVPLVLFFMISSLSSWLLSVLQDREGFEFYIEKFA
jgi:hypothetical protein